MDIAAGLCDVGSQQQLKILLAQTKYCNVFPNSPSSSQLLEQVQAGIRALVIILKQTQKWLLRAQCALI